MLYHGAGALPHGYGTDTSAGTNAGTAVPLSSTDLAKLISSGISSLSDVASSAISGYTTSQQQQLATQQQLAALRLQYQQERALAKIQSGASGAGAGSLPVYVPTQGGGGGMDTTTLLVLGALALGAVVLLTRK